MQAIIYKFMNTLAILGIPVLRPVYSPDLSKATRPHRGANVTSKPPPTPICFALFIQEGEIFQKTKASQQRGKGATQSFRV